MQSADLSGCRQTAETVERRQHISPSSIQVLPMGNTYYYVQYNYNEDITGVLIAEYTDEQLADESFTVPQTYSAAMPYATQKIENTYSGLLLTQSISSEKADGVWTYVSKAANDYDSNGQLAYAWKYTYENGSWSLQSYEGYSYDTYGNCSAIYSYDFSVTPSVSSETFKTYNSLNQLTYESYSVDNEQEYARTYVYDTLGRITSIYDYENTITYSYNSDGSIASYAYNNLVTTFNYSNGRLVSYTDSDNVTRTYSYDSYGNVSGCAFDIYTLEYNTLGSLTEASVNNAEIVSYAYTGAAQNPASETYANGQNVAYTYNADGEITSISLNGTPVYTYSYSTQNNEPVVTITDHAGNLTKTVADDLTAVYQNGVQLYSVENHFGEAGENDFYGAVYTFGGSNFTSINGEDKDTFKTGNAVAFEKEFTYDANYNLTETDIFGVLNETYGYNNNGTITSLINTLSAVTQGYAYTYDTDGNITTITKTVTQNNNTSTVTESYTYDGKNQLVSAVIGNVKWTYTYNARGNITEKKKYTLNGGAETLVSTDTFTYTNTGWQDELTSFNGQSISYDAAGNPTAYLGHTLTWTMGRRLASYDGISYTYNEEGIRTSKTANGVTTRYYLDGTNVIGQTDGTNTLYFRYDSNNSLTSVIYNGTEYFYVKNGLGDITGIANANGALVAEYEYDPWGAVLSVSGSNAALANANPFRYRGYYYDTDTGMYYLQSRYYDPGVCRFINSDDSRYIFVIDNAFNYCSNNPVVFTDYFGTLANPDTLRGLQDLANLLQSLGGYAAAIAAIISVLISFLLIIQSIKSTSRTTTLPDTKVKLPNQNDKVYQIAFISPSGDLIRLSKKYTFVEIITIIGVKETVTHSLAGRYHLTYSNGKNSAYGLAHKEWVKLFSYPSFHDLLLMERNFQWGIYTNKQEYAKALAVVFGNYGPPEYHNVGYYGHYHVLNEKNEHVLHIWFGGKLQ